MKNGGTSHDSEAVLVNLDFFEGDIDMFVELYKELQKKLLADGFNGYFDNVIFSREWWESISLFIQLGFTYEAISHIEKVDDPQFFRREERRMLLKIKGKEQLCKDAKEYLINYLYKVFIQIKTTSYGTIMLKEGNFIDPKIA
ncbi:hypothetical protein KBD33_05190, partial [Candidatus Gracilibacteria bacterium]|nr:hypothetical protein [Candidatus Gracilibacteria bacterium]